MKREDKNKDQRAKQKILDGATQIFMQYGYSKVTMDEIASNLAVSKKTIYKFFTSKEDLLLNVVLHRNDALHCCIEPIYSEEISFIEKMIKIGLLVTDMISKTPVTFLQDMQRNAPTVFKQFKDMKQGYIDKSVMQFMQIGQEENYFRTDIPLDVLVTIYTAIMDSMFKAEIFVDKTYTPSQMYDYIVRIFFEGVMIDGGRKEYFERKEELKKAQSMNLNYKNIK